MADDQKPKTMDINDLVRELSKSSTTPVTPPMSTGPVSQAPRPSFPATPSIGSGPSAKPPMPSPMSGSAPASSIPKPIVPSAPIPSPKPQFNTPLPPLNQPKSVPIATPPTPGVKEYQSSIRTMNEDISKLKQGQQPMGVPIPRKVEPVTPVPQEMPPKPVVLGPQFKVPSVNLGDTRKATSMAPIKNIPGVPPVTPAPKVEPKSQINIPQEGKKGANHNMLFLAVGAVVIVAGFAYWFLVLRVSVPEVVIETPTPTPTLSVAPIQDLKSIFSEVTELEPAGVITGGEFRLVSYLFNLQGIKDKLLEILDIGQVKYPVQLDSVLGLDGAVFYYGQKELFDSKGQIQTSSKVEPRIVMVGELSDPLLVTQAMIDWENTMADDFKILTTTDKSIGYKGSAVNEFLDNNYRGVAIRFKNFPNADQSIDYAIVTALNDKNYVVITNSREAMFATIDKLKGF